MIFMKRSRKKRNNRDLDCMPIACPHCGEILFTVYEGTQNAKIGIPCPECGECTVFDIKLVESREKEVITTNTSIINFLS